MRQVEKMKTKLNQMLYKPKSEKQNKSSLFDFDDVEKFLEKKTKRQ